MKVICTCCGREFDSEDFFDDDKYDESEICPDCLFSGRSTHDPENDEDEFDSDDLDLDEDDLDEDEFDEDFEEDLADDFDESDNY